MSEVDIDALYAGSLHDFVTQRKALAAKLKADGDAAEAKAVRKLQKPALAAWVCNQLVRRHREDVDLLLAVLDHQQQLQMGGIEGGVDTNMLATAREAERAASAKLTTLAGEVLESDGHASSKGNIERALRTLRSAAIDPSAREQLLAGRLSAERSETGLAAMASQVDAAALAASLEAPKEAKPAPAKRRARGAGVMGRALGGRRSARRGAAAAPPVELTSRRASKPAEPQVAAKAAPEPEVVAPKPADDERAQRLAEARLAAKTKRLDEEERQHATKLEAVRRAERQQLEALSKEHDRDRDKRERSKRAKGSSRSEKRQRLRAARRLVEELEDEIAELGDEAEGLDELVARLEKELEAKQLEARAAHRRLGDLRERLSQARRRVRLLEDEG